MKRNKSKSNKFLKSYPHQTEIPDFRKDVQIKKKRKSKTKTKIFFAGSSTIRFDSIVLQHSHKFESKSEQSENNKLLKSARRKYDSQKWCVIINLTIYVFISCFCFARNLVYFLVFYKSKATSWKTDIGISECWQSEELERIIPFFTGAFIDFPFQHKQTHIKQRRRSSKAH